ncbi:hypothetical protein [Oricola nitratireducens]|jgi:hypothetical protein|uniref:hypothetical protein n=1 Tax=Oricola nitratireducens TaxID=2775868 RepID=UPI001868AC77|nr:hypothetical protein [Oricola nitratireducens]
MATRVFLTATVLVVLAAIVTGIAMTGRPSQARKEKFDQLRYRELTAIARILHCEKKSDTRPVLPKELSEDSFREYCGGTTATADMFVDNETGKPYRYRRLNDRDFAVCAKFYDARKAMRSRPFWSIHTYAFNPASGCMTGRAY